MTDILDLSSLSPEETSFTISVDREAEFNNTIDFYEVDADGNVVDADSKAIAPDEEGYADAAIANRLGLDLATDNGKTSEFDVEFTGSTLYAPIIAVDSDFAAFSDNDASNDPTVYFAYEAANADGFDHVISLKSGQFSFEDLPNGGDEDFNDIVLNFEAIEEPEVEEPEVEEPVDETPQVEEPQVEEPEVEEPEVEEPEVEEPEVEEPEVEEPEVEEPEVEEPEVEETPEVEEPEVEEPEVEEPEVEEPVGQTPEVEEPEVEGSISGLKFDDLNGNGIRDSELVQGADPDAVFVIDVSLSTIEQEFAGTVNVGDLNNDGEANQILDAEIAGFTALNQQLVDLGLGDIDLGIITFANSAQTLITTTPNADSDNNGTPDVVDALTTLRGNGGTNFEAALQTSETIFDSFDTESGNSNLIFISDGVPNPDVVNYEDEVANLNSLGVNLSVFGAGEGSRLDRLQVIDPDAQIFTSTDEILNVFGDLNSDADGDAEVDGGGSQSELEPTLTGVTIYIDTNNNGSFDEGEPSQETDDDGEYVFEGLAAGTYTVREVVPDGSTPTTPEEFTITLSEGEAVEDVDFGNISDEALAMLDVESEM